MADAKPDLTLNVSRLQVWAGVALVAIAIGGYTYSVVRFFAHREDVLRITSVVIQQGQEINFLKSLHPEESQEFDRKQRAKQLSEWIQYLEQRRIELLVEE